MTAAKAYHFVTRWHVPGTVEEVAEILADAAAKRYANLSAVAGAGPGGDAGSWRPTSQPPPAITPHRTFDRDRRRSIISAHSHADCPQSRRLLTRHGQVWKPRLPVYSARRRDLAQKNGK
jgi:hypothetical protein